MMQNPDWKFRHAALMAISAAGEGCHKQMEGYLAQIMEAVMQFVNDPHPRVRFACCNALGQMATDFAPIFEKKFHDKVIPGLLHLMDDNGNPRVQVCGIVIVFGRLIGCMRCRRPTFFSRRLLLFDC